MTSKKASPSARRVAARYAAYMPGQVVQEGWSPGTYAPAPVAGDGSQVPPARDSFGNELPADEEETL